MKATLTALMLSGSVALAGHPASEPVPREEDWCRNSHAILSQKAKKGGFEVILLGDSITWEWEANEATGKPVWPQLAALKPATFAVSGDRTEHLLWRMLNGNLEIPEAPRAAVIMIGTNNLGQRNDPPEAVAQGVDMVLETLQKRFPECSLYVYGIFPRGKMPGVGIRKELDATNLLLQEVSKKRGAAYIDIGAEFLLPDGQLDMSRYRDGVHLSEEGYKVWAQSLLKEFGEP